MRREGGREGKIDRERVMSSFSLQGYNMSSQATHEMLEQENDEMVESLGKKVAALKTVSCL